jgi:hypothetical protein
MAVNTNTLGFGSTNSGSSAITNSNTGANGYMLGATGSQTSWANIGTATVVIPDADTLPDGTRSRFGVIISMNGVVQMTAPTGANYGGCTPGTTSATATNCAASVLEIFLCPSASASQCDPNSTTGFPWITTVWSDGTLHALLPFGMTQMAKDVTPTSGSTSSFTVTVYGRSSGASWQVQGNPSFQLDLFLIQTASVAAGF